jgi:SPP1 family predicted phage head-tail adaptor
MRHQVTLQEKSVARDAYGGEAITWVDVATIWAELDPWQLRDRLVLRRQQGEAILSVRVRAPLAASLGKRLLFDGAGYDIIDIDATRQHKGELFITARAEASAP